MVPLEPFKNKVSKSRRQDPRKRSLPGRPTKARHLRRQDPGKRSLPGRPTKASQGTCRDAPRVPARPGERQAPGRDKTTTAAKRLPRQATTLYLHSSTSPTCRPGAFPGTCGKRLCSQRGAVAGDADKIAIMASGGVPDGPFLHYLGDVDGHLMPLSPAVRGR